MIKSLTECIIKSLVESPESVIVSVLHDGDKSTVEVRLAPDDFKRVIGKDGCVIKSLRALLSAASNTNREIRVDVLK